MFARILNRYGILCLTLLIVAGIVFATVKSCNYVKENIPRPRVVVFGASYCRHCPSDSAVKKLAEHYPGMDVYHYQIDDGGEGTEMGKAFGVQRVPQFFFQPMLTIDYADPAKEKCFHSMTALRAWLQHESE